MEILKTICLQYTSSSNKTKRLANFRCSLIFPMFAPLFQKIKLILLYGFIFTIGITTEYISLYLMLRLSGWRFLISPNSTRFTVLIYYFGKPSQSSHISTYVVCDRNYPWNFIQRLANRHAFFGELSSLKYAKNVGRRGYPVC